MDRETPAWHGMMADDALARLGSTADGLDSAEASARLASVGPNALPVVPPRPAWRRLLGHFNSVLIHVLLAAAALSLLLGHLVDTAVIALVVMVNVLVAFVQEGRAQQALGAVQGLLAPACTVLRDGARTTVPVRTVVPGDVVVLESGDSVPADARLLQVGTLFVDEAALTGESLPVEKTAAAVDRNAPLAEHSCMVHAGTLVTAGRALGLVTATGVHTELGRIGRLLGSVQPLDTPLLRQINHFARMLALAIVAFSVLVFLFGVGIRDQAPVDMFMAVIGIAVAAIPEGLPMVVTITLALGAQRMAARHAIVRQLPAVETLGAVGVICSDKTGTLTRNEMSVGTVVTAARRYGVEGVGYAPGGALRPEGGDDDALRGLALAAWLCNNAELRQSEAGWGIDGDPMEAALKVLSLKAGVDPADVARRWPRRDEIPFDAAHRYMATLHSDGSDGGGLLCLKGAPERVLSLCGAQQAADGTAVELDEAYWNAAVETLAEGGQRVLGLAALPMPSPPGRIAAAGIEGRMVLLGLVGLLDPPRDEARAAVAECRDAGIEVKMITGDHAATASAIATQLGLPRAGQPATGTELDTVDADGLRALLGRTDVFARTTPEHKLRLVEALQSGGAIVAMTGDGVNDAPALRRADVGVAMGIKGTDAARQAAAVVLTDDNFASIVAAIREGRTIHDNITKSIAWSLPTNGGEALVIVAALLLGLTLPITPVQILWVNMATAVTLGLTFAFEPAEPGLMQRPPRRPDRALLSGFLLWRIVLVSVLFAGVAFAIFEFAESREYPIEHARTLVVNTIVSLEVFYLFSIRFLTRSSINWTGVLGTRPVLLALAMVVVLQALFTYAPPLQAVFGTHPLSLFDLALVIASGVALLTVLELEKWVRRAAAAHPRKSG